MSTRHPRELKVSDNETMRFTTHGDGTVSVRMRSGRLFDLLRDGANDACHMQAHVGSDGDQYRMWRATEIMWAAAHALLSLATGRYWAVGDEATAIATIERWESMRTDDGCYPMHDGAPGYQI